MPKVSCILPTYNRAARLRERIVEMQIQSLRDWELIIVDDGSTDHTEELVTAAMARDPRIRYYKLEENSQSVTIPRNIGISWASGEFIAHIDDDVVHLPHKLEVLSQALDSDSDCVLVHGHRINLDERVGQSEHFKCSLWNPMNGPGIDGGQFMYRAKCYEQVPLVFARRACDWETAKALYSLGPFKVVNDTVCIYIWHDQNRSHFPITQTRPIIPSKFEKYFNQQTKFILDLRDV